MARAKPTRRSVANRDRVKPAGLLKDLAAAKKVYNPLLSDIQAHLLKEHQKPSDRRQDVLHPSEMAKEDWCPRSSFYRLSEVPPSNPENDKFSFPLEAIFAEGHEIHRKWQQWLTDMGVLWGTWECLLCDARWEDTSPQSCTTPGCLAGASKIRYLEVRLNGYDKFLIIGHEDGAVGDSLIEIKSIGIGTIRFEEPSLLRANQVETVDGKKIYDLDGLWKSIRRPLSSHLRQTAIYQAVAKHLGLPFTKVTFLYEYKANQQVKAFSVGDLSSVAEPLLDAAQDVRYALTTGKAPARPGFTGRDTSTCKSCEWLDFCYEKDDDANCTATVPDDGTATRRSRGAEPATATRRRRSAGTTGGSDGTGRLRTDEAATEPDELVSVCGDAAGPRVGRREIMRKHTRTS